MIRRVLLVVGLIALVATPALSATDVVSKTGEQATIGINSVNVPSQIQADFEYNTGGAINYVPTMSGSATGWAEWFITAVQNTTGQALVLEEFGFPCDGPATGAYGWIVWVGAPVPPTFPGAAATATYYGAFTPASNGGALPPTTYSYVNVAANNIIVPSGSWLWFGYDVTGYGGMTAYNGVETAGWYGGAWDPDSPYGRTAVMQVKANYSNPTPTRQSTWGALKSLYQ